MKTLLFCLKPLCKAVVLLFTLCLLAHPERGWSQPGFPTNGTSLFWRGGVDNITNYANFLCPDYSRVQGRYYSTVAKQGPYYFVPPTNPAAFYSGWTLYVTNSFVSVPNVPVPPMVARYKAKPVGNIWGGQYMSVTKPNASGQFVGTEQYPAGLYMFPQYWIGYEYNGTNLIALGNNNYNPYLPVAPGNLSQISAFGISNDGNAIGQFPTIGSGRTAGPYNAVLWNPAGNVSDLDLLINIPVNTNGLAELSYYNEGIAINNTGNVLVQAQDYTSNYVVSLSGGGSYTIITNVGIGMVAINDNKLVTGTSSTNGFVWANGFFSTIGSLGAGTTIPMAMNSSNQIVGTGSTTGSDINLFLFSYNNSSLQNLGPAPDSGFINKASINDQGTIVYEVGGSYGQTPFLPPDDLYNGNYFYVIDHGVTRNLTNLVQYSEILHQNPFNQSQITGTNVYSVTSIGGINNAGQISTIMSPDGGVSHSAFLLTPVLQLWQPVIMGSNLVVNAWGVDSTAAVVLQGKTDLSSTTWVNVATNPAGSGTVVSFSLPLSSLGTNNWFFQATQ